MLIGYVFLANLTPQTLSLDNAIQEVEVTFTWGGYEGAKGYHFVLTCSRTECVATKDCRYRWASLGHPQDTIEDLPVVTVAVSQVEALGSALVHLRRVDRPQEVIDHTDDYPAFTIRVVTVNGQTIRITSTSNTGWHIPWNVESDKQWYVQDTGEIPQALFSLTKTIQPDVCW